MARSRPHFEKAIFPDESGLVIACPDTAAQPPAMILEINSIDIRAGDEAVFEAAFARCTSLLLRIRGCRAATLLRCIERPGRYQVQIEWDRLSDHIDRYPSTPEAAEVRALLRPLIARAEPAHFEIV